jgi:hypothetical protein
MESKTCIKCEISKPLEDFHKHGGHTDGREGMCKECRKERDKVKSERKSRLRNFW